MEGVSVTEDGEIVGEGDGEDAEPQPDDEDAGDAGKPLSDLLVRDLTAHRTLGLRLAFDEQPDMALVAVVHALAAQTFYRGVPPGPMGRRMVLKPSSVGRYCGGSPRQGWAALPLPVAKL